jgi:hypothetical protein
VVEAFDVGCVLFGGFVFSLPEFGPLLDDGVEFRSPHEPIPQLEIETLFRVKNGEVREALPKVEGHGVGHLLIFGGEEYSLLRLNQSNGKGLIRGEGGICLTRLIGLVHDLVHIPPSFEVGIFGSGSEVLPIPPIILLRTLPQILRFGVEEDVERGFAHPSSSSPSSSSSAQKISSRVETRSPTTLLMSSMLVTSSRERAICPRATRKDVLSI